MEFNRDGAELVRGALNESALAALDHVLSELPADRAGVRIRDCPHLRPMLHANGQIAGIAACYLGRDCRPVRAIFFDKSETTNWALGWHQDRTIAVKEKIEILGFGPWSRKAGVAHTEPPAELLERMVTLRIHLDQVDEENAPLLIAPGSHHLGRVPETQIEAVVSRCGSRACLADRGDIWVYSTLVLHSSEIARRPRRRRVLQVDYSSDELPAGLQFFGI